MKGYLQGLLGSTLWVVLSRFIQLATSFLTTWLLVRQFPVESYGAYRFIFAILAFFTSFASFGIEPVLARFVPEYLERGEYLKINRLLAISITVRVAVLAVLIAVALLLKPFYSEFFNFPAPMHDAFWIVMLIVFLNQSHLVFGSALLSATLEQQKVSLVEIIVTISRFALVAWVASIGGGFRELALVVLATESLAFLVYGGFALQRAAANRQHSLPAASASQRRLKGDRVRIREFAFFSALLGVTGFAREFAIDTFVIAHFLDIRQVGLYAFAAGFVQYLGFLNPGFFLKNVVNYVFVRRYEETRRRESLAHGNQLLVSLSLFVMLPLFAISLILLDPVIRFVFTEAYLASVPTIAILISFVLIQSVFAYGPSHILSVLELTRWRMILSAVIGAYNLGLEIVLVPRMGIEGAAFATGTAGLLTVIAFYWVIQSKGGLKLPLPWVSVGKIVLGAACAVAVAAGILPWISGIGTLLFAFLTSGLVYLMVCAWLKPFEPGDRALLNSVMGRNLWMF